MASYSAEDAKKRYEKLPPEIKGLLYTPGMSFTIQQIGQKNKLHLDQIDTLNTETGQLMLGFVEPKDFPIELAEMLRVDRIQADAIVQDVNDMLLAPIRESMKKVYEQNREVPLSAPQKPPSIEKSVIMPSTVLPSTPAAPLAKLPTISTASAPPMHSADMMLAETTVNMVKKFEPPTPTTPAATTAIPPTKTEVPKPAPYKADPYREPLE
jgi:hypothetical protein